MVKDYFQFIPGVGLSAEEKWKGEGITCWDTFKTNKPRSLTQTKYEEICYHIDKAEKNLKAENSIYFTQQLPSNELWRLVEHFPDKIAYLDIETTGLAHWDKITMIGISDGKESTILTRDIDLDMDVVKEELDKYKLLVTFNGKSFDVPFIEKRYPGTVPNIPHIDLRHLCAKCGYRGGLKAIEKTFGITRGAGSEGLDGSDAVKLWKAYKKTGDKSHLQILADYNKEDILNLKPILDKCVRIMKCKD